MPKKEVYALSPPQGKNHFKMTIFLIDQFPLCCKELPICLFIYLFWRLAAQFLPQFIKAPSVKPWQFLEPFWSPRTGLLIISQIIQKNNIALWKLRKLMVFFYWFKYPDWAVLWFRFVFFPKYIEPMVIKKIQRTIPTQVISLSREFGNC